MRTTTALTLVAATLMMAFAATAGNYEDKKVLYVNSYHKGYAGSDPITQGIEQVLSDQGVELKIHYMDTKNNPEEVFAKAAALEAYRSILADESASRSHRQAANRGVKSLESGR